MANLRFQVVEGAFKKKPLEVIAPVERPSEYFGKNVFNRAKMYKYLPADVYEKLIDVIDNGVLTALLPMRWLKVSNSGLKRMVLLTILTGSNL